MMVFKLLSIVHWHLCIYHMLLSITACMVQLFFSVCGIFDMANIFAMLALYCLLF